MGYAEAFGDDVGEGMRDRRQERLNDADFLDEIGFGDQSDYELEDAVDDSEEASLSQWGDDVGRRRSWGMDVDDDYGRGSPGHDHSDDED